MRRSHEEEVSRTINEQRAFQYDGAGYIMHPVDQRWVMSPWHIRELVRDLQKQVDDLRGQIDELKRGV